MHKAHLIVVHGDRSGEAERSMKAMIATLRNRNPELLIEGAVLMPNPPELHLPHVVESLAQIGVEDLVVIPWFLFAGPHVQHDIPELVKQVQEKYPKLVVRYGEPLAMDSIMVQLLESRLA